jgi:uncharacterized secreted protein with C-terminal beta-propeller domain
MIDLAMDDFVLESAVVMKQSASATSDESFDSSSTDYSTTNLQVDGVDEADIIKSD